MPNRKKSYTLICHEKITIPSKKNSRNIFVSRYTNKITNIPSKGHNKFAETAGYLIKQEANRQKIELINYPISVRLFINKIDRRVRDLDNQLSTILDLLSDLEIIEDDSILIVKEVSAILLEGMEYGFKIEITQL